MAEAGESYDAIVIGAGFGGISCGSLLTKAGLKTLVVDKNAVAGGKALSVSSGGLTYELWPIAGGPSENSRFQQLQDELGIADEAPILVPEAAGEIRYRNTEGEWRSIPISAQARTGMTDGGEMAKALGLKPADLAGLLGLSTQVFTLADEELDKLDSKSFFDWMHEFEIPTPVESYLGAWCNLIFVCPPDKVPASEAIKTLRDFSRGGAGRYGAGGYGRIAEAAASYIQSHGGSMLYNTPVERVIVEDSRVTGVVAGGAEYRAPVVVSNAGIQPTVLKLVGENAFDTSYAERVRSLEPSWAFVGVRYLLSEPVIDQPLTLAIADESWLDSARFAELEAGRWPEFPLTFATVPALYDPSLAPEGKQMALIGTISSPDPASPMGERAIAEVEKACEELWPGIGSKVERREEFTAGHASKISRDAVVPGMGGECIGLAQVIGQCGRSKPDPRAPIGGLYFVGCDAGGYGCGTHQAFDSGFNVAEMVLADLGR